ncbi:MAG: PIN domain-containing protein, partial [Acidobacteriota bacterium]
VFLDVIQKREPHYGASAAVLSNISTGEIGGAVPGHALTTVHYLVSRFANREFANEAIDWILGDFEVVGEGRDIMLRARGLPMEDFEDAVVAAAAEAIHCDWVITRNVTDFKASPISAITPKELAEVLNAS